MKALIALRGSMREIDREHLLSLGYNVTWVEDIDAIRQIESASLRDLFAAHTFGQILAHPDLQSFATSINGLTVMQYGAKRAYEGADALLAERARSLTSKE